MKYLILLCILPACVPYNVYQQKLKEAVTKANQKTSMAAEACESGLASYKRTRNRIEFTCK